jgi:hypothetical protein
MQSCFRERIWSKMFNVRKIKTKKYSFCLPSENLFQILPESEPDQGRRRVNRTI